MGALGLGGLESWKSPAPNEVWTEWMISNDWMIHDEIHAPKWPLVTSSFHDIPFLDTTKERERSMLTALQGEARELPKLDEGLEDKAGAAAQLFDRFGDFFGHTLAHTHDTTRHRQDMTLLYVTDIHNHTHIHIHSKFLGFWNGSHFFQTTTWVLSDMRIRARMDTVIPAPWGPRQCRLDLDGAT